MTIEKKELKPRPDIIAFSSGLTIIPFENVVAASESYSLSGQLDILVRTEKMITLGPVEARQFIEQYNRYLTMQEMMVFEEQE